MSPSKESAMQLGMIGLGRMGANMVHRLLAGGHQCVVFDRSPKAIEELVRANAVGAASVVDLVKKLETPRAVWLMVPAAAVDATIDEVLPGQRARILPDDRRRGRRGEATRSDLCHARTGCGHDRSHSGVGDRGWHRRARVSPLWDEWRRALRQDGHNGIEYGIMAAYAEGLGPGLRLERLVERGALEARAGLREARRLYDLQRIATRTM